MQECFQSITRLTVISCGSNALTSKCIRIIRCPLPQSTTRLLAFAASASRSNIGESWPPEKSSTQYLMFTPYNYPLMQDPSVKNIWEKDKPLFMVWLNKFNGKIFRDAGALLPLELEPEYRWKSSRIFDKEVCMSRIEFSTSRKWCDGNDASGLLRTGDRFDEGE